MKNLHERCERLAALARQEPEPDIDVAADVLRRIRRDQGAPPERTLVWFTAASLAAAAVSVVLTVGLYRTVTDPLWSLFRSVVTLMP